MDTKPIKILLVEMNPAEARMVLAIPSESTGLYMDWVHVTRLSEALDRLQGNRFDIILVNPSLPDSTGLQTVSELLTHSKGIPVIALVGEDEKETALDAVRKGAQDFWVRDQRNHSQLLHSMLSAIERRRFLAELVHSHGVSLTQQKSPVEEDRFNLLLKVAGSTAHDLKQPLTALLGNIELMKLNDDNPEELKGHITEIETASKRISSIVSKMQEIRQEHITSSDQPPMFRLDGLKNILSVEDDENDFRIIEGCLKDQNLLNLSRVKTVKEAFHRLEDLRFDLILTDYVLPDGNALDLLKTMAQKGLDIPLVVVTGQGDEMIATNAIQAGAYDYLSKGMVNRTSLLKAVAYALEKGNLSKEVSQVQKKIVQLSIRDELTGLYNRRYMEEMLETEFTNARTRQTDLSCLIMDLDHFKAVNDRFGHVFGDFVLKEFARTLKDSTRSSDWRFRYGGEEFLLLATNTDLVGAQRLGEKLRRIFQEKS